MQPIGTHSIKKQRSCAYPLYPLSEAVQFAKRISDSLGQGPFSRLSLSKGIGYSSFSGAASGKIGALVHFGLLDRAHASYGLTALALEILAYPAEASLPAIARAAVRPALFEKLCRRFEGKSLPLDLAALLETEFGITAKASPRAVFNFTQTMEFAGILKNNMLAMDSAFSREQKVPLSASPAITAPVQENTSLKSGASFSIPPYIDNDDIKVKLSSGITVIFPAGFSYRLSMGEFADELKNLDRKTSPPPETG